MNWIILGGQGQVGSALTRQAAAHGVSALSLSRADLDLRNPAPLCDLIARRRPGFVINAAAYTDVERAEGAAVEAFAVNAEAPGAIAVICKDMGVPLFHFSSDYVFDGEKPAPYIESDAIGPLSVYGRSKAAGEEAVRRAHREHIIVRTSGVFSADGRNFVKIMLGLGRERRRLRVVDDQHSRPTSADHLAAAVHLLTQQLAKHGSSCERWGTYHLAGAPTTSWHGFARELFDARAELMGNGAPVLEAITTDQHPAATTRPKNAALDCGKIRAAFGIEPCDWRRDLRRVLAELQAKGKLG